jgi:hypothetical protein
MLDIAWELLMDPSFEALRHTIYTTGDEKRRFRQVRRPIAALLVVAAALIAGFSLKMFVLLDCSFS